MYDGFWEFGGEEIVNHARTQAYLDEGFQPGTSVTTADNPDDLARLVDIVNGGVPYSSPIQDRAPWIESGDPDTWDFAGPIVLEMTGADGSTRSATVTEFTTNGGVAGRARYGTRTVAVTALLVGRTTASVNAGLSWLSSALAGADCSACLGEELCGYSAMPDGYDDAPLVDAPPVTEVLDRRIDGWIVSRGRFRSRDGWFDPSAAEAGEIGQYGAGKYGFSVYGGAPEVPSEPRLSAPAQPCYSGPVTWRWNVSTLSGSVRASVGALAEDGETVLARTETATYQGDTSLPFVPDPAWQSWIPTIWIEGNPVRVAPTITHRPYQTAERCADSYLRSYLDVTTVDGPKPLQWITFPCGQKALKVEWTWVVGNPFIFGAITPLVTGYSTATATPDALEPGVVAQALAGTLQAVPRQTPPSLESMLDDPCCPGFIVPPKPPTIADACWAEPGEWSRWTFTVPPRVVPANDDGLVSFAFTNDSRPKRGVRVRLYADPLGRGMAGLDEDAFCAEFNLTYIPPDATVTIDSARGRVETTLPGLSPVNTSATVRGTGGSTLTFPALACNTPYVVALDVPTAYDRACGTYPAGDPQGDLVLDVTLRPATV